MQLEHFHTPNQTLTPKPNRYHINIKHLAVTTLIFSFNSNHPNKHMKALNSFQKCENSTVI